MKKTMIWLTVLCMLLCPLLASASGVTGWLNQKMATRSGPGTKYTEELGTFSQSTSITVIDRVERNGTVWCQVEFTSRGQWYRAYTGLKRIETYEYIPWANDNGADAYMTRSAQVYYGPGSWYAQRGGRLSSGTSVLLYAYENGYAQVEYMAGSSYIRGWVDSSCVSTERQREWDYGGSSGYSGNSYSGNTGYSGNSYSGNSYSGYSGNNYSGYSGNSYSGVSGTTVTRVRTLERGCNLRAEPRMGDNILYKIHSNTELDVLGMVNGWYNVSYRQYTGYIDPAYTTPIGYGSSYNSGYSGSSYGGSAGGSYGYSGGSSVSGRTAVTGSRGCNVRSSMDLETDSNIVKKVHAGVSVEVLDSQYDYTGRLWYYVRTQDGIQGWAASGNLTLR